MGGHDKEEGRGETKPASKQVLRLLRFVLKTPLKMQPAARMGAYLLSNEEQGCLVVDEALLQHLTEQQLLHRDQDMLYPTDKTTADISQLLQNTEHNTQEAHSPYALPLKTRNTIGRKTVIVDGEAQELDYNWAESPLCALYRLNKTTGQRFLSTQEFQAGERLRRDFTRANMLPKISANWEQGSTPRAKGMSGGAMQISDAALASRLRVEQALVSVGPELSGVLIDICCFLKGIERVERERNWPVRSAKILLKAALSALNRHYAASKPQDAQKPDASSSILHWGSGDYRPAL